MSNILGQDVPVEVSEDLSQLHTEKAIISARISELQQEASTLAERLKAIDSELVANNSELERLSSREKSVTEARAALNAPFTL